MAPYSVYRCEYTSIPRNHQALFVETSAVGHGTLYHVVGSMQTGMMYEVRPMAKTPDESSTFLSKTYLGQIDPDELGDFERICRGINVPGKQFNGPRRINPDMPLRHCQHWVADATRELRAQHVLQEGAVDARLSDISSGSGGGSPRASPRGSAVARAAPSAGHASASNSPRATPKVASAAPAARAVASPRGSGAAVSAKPAAKPSTSRGKQ